MIFLITTKKGVAIATPFSYHAYKKLVLFISIFLNDALHVSGSEAAEDLAVNQSDGSQTACADAAQRGEGEQTVLVRLADRDVQFVGERIQDLLGTTHVAGRTHTHRHRVFTLRHHGEERVEGDDTVNLCGRDVQSLSNQLLRFSRQIAEVILCLMQNVNQFARSIIESVADLNNLVADFLFHFDNYLIHNGVFLIIDEY